MSRGINIAALTPKIEEMPHLTCEKFSGLSSRVSCVVQFVACRDPIDLSTCRLFGNGRDFSNDDASLRIRKYKWVEGETHTIDIVP